MTGASAGHARADSQPERRDVELSALALDALDDRGGDLLRRSRADPPRQLHAAVREEPASLTKPGKTTLTPMPRGSTSSRRPAANPRRPNLVAE